jgi:hypothetical protein
MSSSKYKLRFLGALAALATLALAVSCRGFFPPEQLASITIQPSTVTVPLGGTTQMHAFGVNQDGTQAGEVTSKVSWSSDNGAVGVNSTDQPGLLTGVGLSTTTATITGSYQALTPETATASVCVEGGTNFQVLPANNTTVSAALVFPNNGGFTASIDAQVSGTDQTVDITSGVLWSSSNDADLSITSGTDPATVLLTADVSGGTVPVSVSATYTCNGVTMTNTETINVSP